MQFSESWLRSLCNPSLSRDELCHTLTMAGLEVEDVKPAAPLFEHVVVARVLSVAKHPNADKLNVCEVDIGSGKQLQIVCGAANVAPNMKVPCALVGARLPGVVIEQAKVRGVDSFGMLCSAKELGLNADSEGLLVLHEIASVGDGIRQYLELDDYLITLKLTPNRADCLSLTGIARELSALTGAAISQSQQCPANVVLSDTRQVVLNAPEACPRYCGRVIRGINAKANVPEWLKRRIERSGIRSISAVVDITNYVMLELGQPLHAFDNAKLTGSIHVRFPHPGETLTLLNERVLNLAPDMLIIADEKGPLALAGIMGGIDSSISDTTSDVFLESAFFAPHSVVGRARTLGFVSDASHRFERGVDPELSHRANERATELILEICGGQAGPIGESVVSDFLPSRKQVRLRPARIARVLGLPLPTVEICQTLGRLGLTFETHGDDLLVTPPSFRFDIEIEEDLIEEIARVYGYSTIPASPPVARTLMLSASETSRTPSQLRRLVASRNYQEVVTYSFISTESNIDFADTPEKCSISIQLANPIASHMDTMRSSLFGGLASTLAFNRKRGAERVRIFETGRCFFKAPDSGNSVPFAQPMRLGGLAAGYAEDEQWGVSSRVVDFFDVKADVEALLSPLLPVFSISQHAALHPGRSATISIAGKPIGVIGEIHPRLMQKYELGKSAVMFELDMSALLVMPFSRYQEVSRFPAVVRDLALVVDLGQPMIPILDALRAAAPAIVRDISLFDVYQGKGIGESEKSLAFRIVMQDTQRTLEDLEIEDVVTQLRLMATRDFQATLRA